jgi:hypothetical protein
LTRRVYDYTGVKECEMVTIMRMARGGGTVQITRGEGEDITYASAINKRGHG